MSRSASEIVKSKTLVISLDFDGCSDRAFSQEAILNHIVESSKHIEDLTRIVLMIGSLRQSLFLDILNARNNSQYPNFISCTSLYEEFLPRVRESVVPSIEIIFDTYLQCDSFNQLEPGTTFEVMRKTFKEIDHLHINNYEHEHEYFTEYVTTTNKSNDTINLLKARHMADCSKISIIYAQLHRMASLYPEDDIVMHFYDDKTTILGNLHHFYKNNSQWISEQLCLSFYHQIANPEHSPTLIAEPLKGKGPTNQNYDTHLLQLAEIHRWDSTHEEYKGFATTFRQIFPTIEIEPEFTPTKINPTYHYQGPSYQTIFIPPRFGSYDEKMAHLSLVNNEALEILFQLKKIEEQEFLKICKNFDDLQTFTSINQLDSSDTIYNYTYQLFKLNQLQLNRENRNKTHTREIKIENSDDYDEEELKEAKVYAELREQFNIRCEFLQKEFDSILADIHRKIISTPIVRILAPIARRPTSKLSLFNPQDLKNNSSPPHSPK